MSHKLGNYSKVDILKEMMWTLIFVVAFFGYWIELILVIAFIFHSNINLSFDSIILMAIILSFSIIIYRMIRISMKMARH
ncbi:MAG: hypothetical protein K0S01_4106 [Herbinix sp.]|jgi:hypothetical protein|nr:hypothetical protein [Herbinix sp.]